MRFANTAPDLNKTFSKTCPVCRYAWRSRNEFLSDPGLELIGYQVSFKELTAGLFLFNHTCKGTLAIRAQVFQDLYDGPMFSQRVTGGPGCPGHCLHESDLRPCPEQCECSYVREIMQIIQNWAGKSGMDEKTA
jgi:hypothetical protein